MDGLAGGPERIPLRPFAQSKERTMNEEDQPIFDTFIKARINSSN
jgi:hypothetical protein